MPKTDYLPSHKAYREWLEKEKGLMNKKTALSTYYGSVTSESASSFFGICVANGLCLANEDLIEADIVRFFEILDGFLCLDAEEAGVSKSVLSSAGSHARALLEYKKSELYKRGAADADNNSELALTVMEQLVSVFGFNRKYEAYEKIRNTLIGSYILPPVKEKADAIRDFTIPGVYTPDNNCLLISQLVKTAWRTDRAGLAGRLKRMLLPQIKKMHNESNDIDAEPVDILSDVLYKLSDSLWQKLSGIAGFECSTFDSMLCRMHSFKEKVLECPDENKLYLLLCELVVSAFASCGKTFSQSLFMYPDAKRDRRLIAFLLPLIKKINREKLKREVLYNNDYLKRLLEIKAIYPSFYGDDILVTKNLRCELSLDSAGLVNAGEIWSDNQELEMLEFILGVIYSGMIQALEVKSYDRELFELTDETRMLLGAAIDKKPTTKAGHNLKSWIIGSFALCYLYSVYITGEENGYAAERLVQLYVKSPVELLSALRDFADASGAKPDLSCTNDGVHLIKAQWQNIIAGSHLKRALAADNAQVESLLNRAVICAKDALEISRGYDKNKALDALSVLVRAETGLCDMHGQAYKAAGLERYFASEYITPLLEHLEEIKAIDESEYSTLLADMPELEKYLSYKCEEGALLSSLISSGELHNSLLGNKELSALIYVPGNIDRSHLFSSYYVADFDSAIASHRGFGYSDIELPIMNLLLTMKPVILSPNQIIDHDILLSLAQYPGYLDLYKRGYINLSFYNSAGVLEYAAKQLERADFEWSSSLGFVNCTDDMQLNADIMKTRKHIAEYLRGEHNLESAYFSAVNAGADEYMFVKRYKENLRLIDENSPAVSRTLYYQHNEKIGNSDLLLTKWLDNFYAKKSDGFFAGRTVHDIITQSLPDVKEKGYKRTHYKVMLDRILHGKLDGLVMNKLQENTILSLADASARGAVLDPMYDALHDCYNFVVGSLISADQFRNYASDNSIPSLDSNFVSLKNRRFESRRHDSFVSVTETGKTIKFDELSEYLAGIRARVDESRTLSELERALNANSETASRLAYSVDDNGVQIISTAFEITSGEKLVIDTEKSAEAHIRIGFETKEK
ncbi:MAG: hypothetical protein J6V93_00270 [Clostridia bacterium]|nr:hypothetical protein [Clostridia bacterium]